MLHLSNNMNEKYLAVSSQTKAFKSYLTFEGFNLRQFLRKLFFRNKFHRQGIDTMPSILCS